MIWIMTLCRLVCDAVAPTFHGPGGGSSFVFALVTVELPQDALPDRSCTIRLITLTVSRETFIRRCVDPDLDIYGKRMLTAAGSSAGVLGAVTHELLIASF